jgi:hypothetical protein
MSLSRGGWWRELGRGVGGLELEMVLIEGNFLEWGEMPVLVGGRRVDVLRQGSL